MQHIDPNTFNQTSNEFDFYFSKILGDQGVSCRDMELYRFVLTPTYYLKKTAYYDYRSTILNLLILSEIADFRQTLGYVIKMYQEEEVYRFADPVVKNEYNIYSLIYQVATCNNWTIDSNLLIKIEPKEYPTNLLVDRLTCLSNLDFKLRVTTAKELVGLFQRVYRLK